VFVSAEIAERYKQEAADAKAKAEAAAAQAQQKAQASAEQYRASYPAKLQFDYIFDHGKAPFNVSAIYRDDKFTYIRAQPQEVPALYEVKDGKPSLVNYDFANGLYTVPKILEAGYLAVGKQKMSFTLERR
jgi:type IV secretion system protein VirB9